ncbi:hypothetical protein BDQ12DRAFT_771399 [Crucibulum laeve]|uniref:Glycosyltransferase 61 catalytic domain-containing protein n=1 Tax=Crucibulum laeve TaxID=68775 RepID=A0A5C3LIW7_9AGAR|nr:hypothetical protein BDQ12DRAFT_771399 [Crucibulum laeve]
MASNRLYIILISSFLLVLILGFTFDSSLRPRLHGFASPSFDTLTPLLEVNETRLSAGVQDSSIAADDIHPIHLNDVSTETTIPSGAHVHGFTILDRVYLRNGTFYILTSDASRFPPRRNLISRPWKKVMGLNLDPTDEDMQFIDIERAHEVLGSHALRIPDFSVIVYDHPQFMTHFYHWWGEVILGAWRVYSKLSIELDSGIKALPFPSRFILPVVNVIEEGWRDKAGVDGPLMRAAFPGSSIEVADAWQDYKKLNVTVVFDRIMLISRDAAHKHPFGGRWFKMIAGTMNLTVPDGFWGPVQRSLVDNLLGGIPNVNDDGLVVYPPEFTSSRPIVTYISRQGGGRRLLEKDHERLVISLKDLEVEGICQVNVAQMELLSLKDQIALVARSTVIVGVHGNGLTHQLWMPWSKRSTVIEIVYPESYDWDYEMLARNMGHKALWNDTLITYPKGTYYKGVTIGENFHGNSIPVYGPAIAKTIRDLLIDEVGK